MPATLFVVPTVDTTDVINSTADDQEFGFCSALVDRSKLTSYIKSKHSPVRGDVARVEDVYDPCYGGGQYIFDGTSFIMFNGGEFAEIPSTFHVITEFPLDHWDEVNIGSKVWLDLPLFRSKLLANIERGHLPYVKEAVTHTCFYHDGDYYQLVFDTEDGKYDTTEEIMLKISDLTSLHLEAHPRPFILHETDIPIPFNVLFTW